MTFVAAEPTSEQLELLSQQIERLHRASSLLAVNVEQTLHLALATFDNLKSVSKHWAQSVRNGTLQPLGQESDEIRLLYRRWLHLAEIVRSDLVDVQPQDSADVEASGLRRAIIDVELILKIDAESIPSELDVNAITLGEMRNVLRPKA